MKLICEYCGEDANGYLVLGRGNMTQETPCCAECFDAVNSLPRKRKNEMAEAAFMAKMGGAKHE